ncbi:alcohol dehydrogenase [Longimonas halophila]|uniref:Alcohol dehydrogenase n=2 Tax=Longimonas halophila TaxID=1469170 RepID=A0A2H3P0P1_9BACT|nr:alcohol dehydrogenase [Longimonas halophila]
MRAVRLHGPGDVRVESVEVPSPVANGQVRLRMRSVGICGSDLHHYREGSTGGNAPDSPLVLGHEIAAEVPPESADTLGLEAGTLVAVDPAHPCRRCEWCERGHPNLCPHVEFKGVEAHRGGLTEYLMAYPDEIIPVPKSFDADTTALLEPLGVAIHALDLAKLRVMDTVAVLGAGPIGLLCAQVAQAVGAGSCYVVDPLEYRTEMAADLGADAVATDLSAIEEWTSGRGVDVVIEATNDPKGIGDALHSVRIGGDVVLVGIPEGNEHILTASTARRKGATVKWSRRMGHVYPRAIRMVQSGRVAIDPLITHRFPLSESPEALALQSRYDDGVIKAAVYQEAGL